jgi:hypothetical protein
VHEAAGIAGSYSENVVVIRQEKISASHVQWLKGSPQRSKSSMK